MTPVSLSSNRVPAMLTLTLARVAFIDSGLIPWAQAHPGYAKISHLSGGMALLLSSDGSLVECASSKYVNALRSRTEIQTSWLGGVSGAPCSEWGPALPQPMAWRELSGSHLQW